MKREISIKIWMVILGVTTICLFLFEAYRATVIVNEFTGEMYMDDTGMIFPNLITRLKWLIGGCIGETHSLSEIYEVTDYMEERINVLSPSWYFVLNKILVLIIFGAICYEAGKQKKLHLNK